MKAPATVEQFTVAALERLGGAAEEEAPGLFTVLWPARGMTDVETRRLAFDPEALDEAPDAELVTFASPTLEEVVQLATASGQVARAFLNAVLLGLPGELVVVPGGSAGFARERVRDDAVPLGAALHFREAERVAPAKVEAPAPLGAKAPDELVLDVRLVGSRPGRLDLGDEADGVAQLVHRPNVSRALGGPHMPAEGIKHLDRGTRAVLSACSTRPPCGGSDRFVRRSCGPADLGHGLGDA